jgi:hypothetical protein
MEMSMRAWLITVWAIALASCSSGADRSAKGAGRGGDTGPAPAFSADAALRACVLAAACVSPAFQLRGAECVHALERGNVGYLGTDLQRFATCAMSGATCEEVLECASLRHGPGYCQDHPGYSCDGDWSVYCSSDFTPVWAITQPEDCAAHGMTCANGVCTDGKTCNGPVVLSCIDNKLTYCDLTRMNESARDCGVTFSGGRCGASPSSFSVDCLPAQSETCPSGAVTPYACSGNILLGCNGVLKGTLDCGAIDSECRTADDSFFLDCMPKATDCTRNSLEVCHGSSVSICVDGRYRDVDCASLNLGPCQPMLDGGAACGRPNN